MLISGVSRGGALSIAYAGTRAGVFIGATNFVGGWMSDYSASTRKINNTAFRRGAANKSPTLWLYAANDPFYSISHSRNNFDAFINASGTGNFHVLAVLPSDNGHRISSNSTLWTTLVDAYLARVLR
jgi:hypothetical protein